MDGPQDWRIKIGHRSADEPGGFRIYGASWEPLFWMPMPAAPGAIRQAAAQPDQFAGSGKLIHKQISVEFFRWWYNQPGNNTEQGFDDWWEKRREDKR